MGSDPKEPVHPWLNGQITQGPAASARTELGSKVAAMGRSQAMGRGTGSL